MTIQTALLQGTEILEQEGIAAPRLTAEVLLAHAVRCDRVWLYAHGADELKEVWWIHYGRYLRERIDGKPTQYITHHQEFYGRAFYVDPSVLIPRPETEHLIEHTLALQPRGPIVDVGTGSGAIAITLQLETGLSVFANDISAPALDIARRNNGALKAQVHFFQSDLLSAMRDHSVQVVVSNPPYIPNQEHLPREVVAHEPHVALFGGTDGLDNYRRLTAEAERVLIPGGYLLMETAYNAEEPLTAMLRPRWQDIVMHRDLAGLPRVIAAKKPS